MVRTAVFKSLEKGQGLNGFAKSHVICQTTPKTIFVEEHEPVKAGFLVGSQFPFEPPGNRGVFNGFKIAQLLQFFIDTDPGKFVVFKIFDKGQMVFVQDDLVIIMLIHEGKKLRIFCKPGIGNDAGFPVGQQNFIFFVKHQLSELFEFDFIVAKPDGGMDVKPVDVFRYIYGNGRISDIIFFPGRRCFLF